MDYGLNITDLIYTDENRYDLGTLSDYEVDLDLAGEKDFELSIDEFVIPEKGFWYVDGKEYGGVIDGFETDSKSGYRIKYIGRSWRGILASRVIFSSDTKGSISIGGEISNCINELLKKYNLSSLFICDEIGNDNIALLTGGLVDDQGRFLVDEGGQILADYTKTKATYTISETTVPIGKTVYDVIIELGDSIGFNYELQYNHKDKKVHIKPILAIDYTDYLTYSRDNSVDFKFSKNSKITNHLICCGQDENAKQRVIHLFTDEGGAIQPYAKKAKPIQDSDYILDESRKAIKGIHEIVEFYEGNVTAEENYVLLTSQPSNWSKNYSTYYIKNLNQSTANESIYTVNSKKLVTLPFTATRGHLQVSQGSKALRENIDYWIQGKKASSKVIEFHNNYKNEPVTIAEIVDGKETYDAVSGVTRDTYTVLNSKPVDWPNTYMYYYKRSWSQANRAYEYSEVSGNTELDYSKLTKISQKPTDWQVNYGQYYYYFQTGTNNELRTYSSTSEPKYTLLSNKPSNWDTSVTSYYKKQYTIKSSDGTETNYDSYVRGSTVTYASLQFNSNKSAPSFIKNKYYRQDNKEVIPAFNASNCYLPGSKTATPTWYNGVYFKKSTSMVAPTFAKNRYYRLYYDHFMTLVSDGIKHLNDLRSGESQNVTIDNVSMNIGDTVGGRDDVTGYVTAEKITNIIIKIKRGVLDAEYEIGGR